MKRKPKTTDIEKMLSLLAFLFIIIAGVAILLDLLWKKQKVEKPALLQDLFILGAAVIIVKRLIGT